MTTVPDEIITKDGPLDDDEWAVIRMHPGAVSRHARPGAGLRAGARDRAREPRAHRRLGLSAPPRRRGGSRCGARILLAVESYLAMTAEHPYGGMLSPEDGLERIELGAGLHLRPARRRGARGRARAAARHRVARHAAHAARHASISGCSRSPSRSAPASSGARPTSSAACTRAGSRSRPVLVVSQLAGLVAAGGRAPLLTGAVRRAGVRHRAGRRGVRRRRHRRLLPRPRDRHDQHRLAGERVRRARAGGAGAGRRASGPARSPSWARRSRSPGRCSHRCTSTPATIRPRAARSCSRRPRRSASAASCSSSAMPPAAATRCRRSWAGAARRSRCSWPARSSPAARCGSPRGRDPGRRAASGCSTSGANALFAAAAQRGYLSVVSVLGSEYPVVTVILAQTHPARARLAAAGGGDRARARGHRHRQRELTRCREKIPKTGDAAGGGGVRLPSVGSSSGGPPGGVSKRTRRARLRTWADEWRGPGSNWRHRDFQSRALPTELPRRGGSHTTPPARPALEVQRPPGRCYRSSKAVAITCIRARFRPAVKSIRATGSGPGRRRSRRRPRWRSARRHCPG